jgi:hypothetical protein
LAGSFGDYTDSDSDGTGDVDTTEGTEAGTEADTEADTETDTEADTDPIDGVTDVTVPELRNGEISQGTQVRVSGVRVVSPQTSADFWVQSYVEGLYQGIYVYDGATAVAPVGLGDQVTVTGEFVSGNGSLFEIVVTDPTAVQVTGTNNNKLVWGGAHGTLASLSSAELLESNLVLIGPSVVTVAPDNFGLYVVQAVDGGPTVRVDDLFYSDNPEVGDVPESMKGGLNFAFGFFRLETRFAADLPVFSGNGDCPVPLWVEDLGIGEIIVTEVGFNPSDTIGLDDSNEFFEVYNLCGVSVNRDGLLLRDNNGESVVT